MTVVYNPAKQASSAGRRCPGSIQGLCPGVVCTTWRLDACRHSANQCLAFLVAGTSARLIVVNWTAPVSICPRTGVERLPVFRPQWPLPIAPILWGSASITFLAIENMRPHFFGPRLLWPNGWMDQDTTWYGGMPRPRRHCVRWRPSSP